MNANSGLVLNVVPITFASDRIRVGRLPFTNHDSYRTLREEHWRSRAFRLDSRLGEILNVSLKPDVKPLGQVTDVAISEHLLLAARAVQQAILIRIVSRVPILQHNNKKLLFWGKADEALLLSQAAKSARVAPILNLEVPIRYEVDCRLFYDRTDNPYLGLVIDIGTANVIDIPVSELMAKRLSVVDRNVSHRTDREKAYLHPSLEVLGRVAAVDGDTLLLADTTGPTEVSAQDVVLEPRTENLQAAIEVMYGRAAPAVWTALTKLRQPLASSAAKLTRVRDTVDLLKKQTLTLGDGIKLELGDLLTEGSPLFPQPISTSRPTLLFGAQGRNTGQVPDAGIRSWGPYMFMHHTRNDPVVAVICEAKNRGTVEQFVSTLKDGYPDDAWHNVREANPYRGGLVGKFRLRRVRIEYEECTDVSVTEYRAAARRLLGRLPDPPDLALVQTRAEFIQRQGQDNPYLAVKAAFMRAGVPIQAVFVEKMAWGEGLAYILNTVALASYAKLQGTPWVVSTKGTTTHELVIGIGSAEVSTGRPGSRDRYVGITSVFQGDGRYLVWNQTREVRFDEYAEELLATLRVAIRHIASQYGWEEGDEVRLIAHVYKRLKDTEVEAIKSLVKELMDGRFKVKFAFLDVSTFHPFRLFVPGQAGVEYWRNGSRRIRGKGVPDRGICLQLDRRRALLHLTGPKEVKTEEQGLPAPLLLELHPDSDFTDLAYLARQCYHFTYASWRSFHPAPEPVTILYSRQIARLLGSMRAVPDWDSGLLAEGPLRDRCWFL